MEEIDNLLMDGKALEIILADVIDAKIIDFRRKTGYEVSKIVIERIPDYPIHLYSVVHVVIKINGLNEFKISIERNKENE